MFQGTGSDVGKSFLVAGLARAYTRRGLGVRPFKPQNMSNNAAVAADGGEIGRAQALQARACGVAPSIHMNPVLLKPESDRGAQVVVQGRVLGSARARGYIALKPALMPKVLESFARLGREADLVLVEGAGSAAEVNLRAADIANMGFALAADVPVVLIGDIDRGGVIASLVGTCALLTDGERALLAGHIVNRFRGDPALFDAGLAVIAERTGIDCFGVVPYFAEAHRLPAEDAVALERPAPAPDDAGSESPRPIRISVLRLSRISNFDDFDPLAAEADVELRILRPGEALPGDCDLVILPGSKAALADLAMLRAEGWDIDILAHRRRGGMVLGICGGFQMLGRRIADPGGVEGPPGEVEGLGLLDVETELKGDKILREIAGRDARADVPVRGYEMHMGRTLGPGIERPMLTLAGGPDGAVSADGRVMGCYLHGLFTSAPFRNAFLGRIRTRRDGGLVWHAELDRLLDRAPPALGGSCQRNPCRPDGILVAPRRSPAVTRLEPRMAYQVGDASESGVSLRTMQVCADGSSRWLRPSSWPSASTSTRSRATTSVPEIGRASWRERV